VDALEEKKGEDIVLLDIHEVTSFTDYFVICTGTSNRMLNALADAANDKTREKHQRKGRVEGTPDAGWIVVDYGDVVVHVFDEELRRFYKLEDLWKEGKILLRVQ
jgi:ribosome-associated protein